jgi:glycosyltransferase involved in cell wall biosynthesis
MNVLILAPYDKIYPPSNGGMQRTLNLILQISKYNNVVLLSYQSKEKFIQINRDVAWANNITYVQVPFTDNGRKYGIVNRVFNKLKNALIYRYYTKTILRSADINFLNYYPEVNRILKSTPIDIVYIDHFGLLNILPPIKKYAKGFKSIYNAHNIESHLAFDYFKKNIIRLRTFRNIIKFEKELYKIVDDVWVCSEKDKAAIEKINKGKLCCISIPNGVKIDNGYKEIYKKEFDIIFCGSMNYQPNKEGLIWFLDKCWLELKQRKNDIKLLVIGSGDADELLNIKLSENGIVFHRNVSDVSVYYNQSKISIAPIFIGSGTRLKILESMAFNVPVVSTSKGAEGIDYTDNQNILIADSDAEFINKIISLINNDGLKKEISKNAFQLVSDKYNWDGIGVKVNNRLNSL